MELGLALEVAIKQGVPSALVADVAVTNHRATLKKMFMAEAKAFLSLHKECGDIARLHKQRTKAKALLEVIRARQALLGQRRGAFETRWEQLRKPMTQPTLRLVKAA